LRSPLLEHSGLFVPELGELLRRAPASRPVDNPDPTSLSSARATTGAGGVRTSLFRFEGGTRPSGRSGRSVRVPWAARHRALRAVGAVARGLCPSFVG